MGQTDRRTDTIRLLYAAYGYGDGCQQQHFNIRTHPTTLLHLISSKLTSAHFIREATQFAMAATDHNAPISSDEMR